MHPTLRRRLARLARRHHGIVTREELLALGLTTETVDWALTSRQLVALFPGVYRVNGAPDTWRSRAYAAQRRVERQLRRRDDPEAPAPLVAVGGEAAAYLHDLPGHTRPPRSLVVVTSRRCRSTAVTVRRRVQLTAADVGEVDGIPTTSLAWSGVETAAARRRAAAGDVLAHLVGTGRLRPGQLLGPAHRTAALPGRAAVIRQLTAMAGPVDHVRSGTEKLIVDALAELGIHDARLNWVVATSSGPSHELDMAFLDAMLDVEIDGPHHLQPSQRRRDRARDRDLRADGWEVTRFPVEEVDDDPADVARRIAAIRARRLAER